VTLIKGIIFDVDGVLIDTEELHFQAFKSVFKDHNFSLTHEGYKKWFSGRSLDGGFAAFHKDNNLSIDISELKSEKISLTRAIFSSKLKFYDDSLKFIYESGNAKLKGIGSVAHEPILALVTGLEREFIPLIIDKSPQLKGAFKVIVAAEDYKQSKPSPECYTKALSQMRLSPDEVIGVEDTPSGIQALNSAGIYSIGLATTHSKEDLKAASIITDSLMSLVEKQNL